MSALGVAGRGTLIVTLVVGCVSGCSRQGDESTIRAYTGTQDSVIVRLDAGDASGTWVLPGGDDVQLLYAGRAVVGDARLEFLDATTCAVLATASGLPTRARVGLDLVDPSYIATVSPDDGGAGEIIHRAVATSQCQSH